MSMNSLLGGVLGMAASTIGESSSPISSFKLLTCYQVIRQLPMPAIISCHQPGLPSLSHLYHIGLGGGGKVFQQVEVWESKVLDIKLENHEVLTFGHWRMLSLSRALFVSVTDEAFRELKTLVSGARCLYLWRRLHGGCLLLPRYFLIRVNNKVYISVP